MVHVKIVLDTGRQADGTYFIIYRITDVERLSNTENGLPFWTKLRGNIKL